MHIRALTIKICTRMCKRKGDSISLSEFLIWSNDVVDKTLDDSTVFDVYRYFVQETGGSLADDPLPDPPDVNGNNREFIIPISAIVTTPLPITTPQAKAENSEKSLKSRITTSASSETKADSSSALMPMSRLVCAPIFAGAFALSLLPAVLRVPAPDGFEAERRASAGANSTVEHDRRRTSDPVDAPGTRHDGDLRRLPGRRRQRADLRSGRVARGHGP